MLEHEFQRKVKAELSKLPRCYFFVKEAASLRGIPDLIGCINGRFFALEVKRSYKEASKTTGRIVLQKHSLKQIKDSGGIGLLIYPENFKECLEELKNQAL